MRTQRCALPRCPQVDRRLFVFANPSHPKDVRECSCKAFLGIYTLFPDILGMRRVCKDTASTRFFKLSSEARRSFVSLPRKRVCEFIHLRLRAHLRGSPTHGVTMPETNSNLSAKSGIPSRCSQKEHGTLLAGHVLDISGIGFTRSP